MKAKILLGLVPHTNCSVNGIYDCLHVKKIDPFSDKQMYKILIFNKLLLQCRFEYNCTITETIVAFVATFMVCYIRRITISEGKVTTRLLDMDTFLYDDKTLQMSDDKTLQMSDDKTLQMSDDKTLQMSDDKTLQMSDILQSLTDNCQIPRGCTTGLVLCDHNTNALSTINTCAPSINITTKKVKSYDDFKTMMVSMLCDDEGFGLKQAACFFVMTSHIIFHGAYCTRMLTYIARCRK